MAAWWVCVWYVWCMVCMHVVHGLGGGGGVVHGVSVCVMSAFMSMCVHVCNV